MSFIIGGLLRGVGQFMVEDWRAQRDAALEQLRQQAADRRSDRQFEQSRQLQQEGIEQRGTQERQTLGIANQNELTQIRERGNIEGRLQDDRQNFDRSVEDLRHRYRLSEANETFLRERRAQLEDAGNSVDRVMVGRDGTAFFLNERGRVISRSDPGTFSDPEAIRGAAGRGGRSGRTGATTASPEGSTGRAASGERDQVILRQYGPVVDELYGRLPPTERLQRAREMAGRYGL